jgi:hypothetical protein
MTAIVLPAMTSPAQEQGWQVLLDLTQTFPNGWCLVGGQMVWLLATEHGTDPPRATNDVDLVVDIRAEPGGIRKMCRWLESSRFQLDGISPEGIGHRYTRAADPGSGKVIFDVLAPDNIGSRADLSTTQGARTLQTPGARKAIDTSEAIEVTLGQRNGRVHRPTLIAAIILKAVTSTIPTRTDISRDLADAAFMLSLIADPIATAESLTKSDRKGLLLIRALRWRRHCSGRRRY